MSAIEELFHEVEKHAVLRGHAKLCLAAKTELYALQERVEAQQKMLKRLEWNGYGFCEICGEYRTHIPDCDLAALLKETT